MRRLELMRPRDLVPSPSLRGPNGCWLSAGLRSSEGVAACSLDCVWSLAIAGAQGTGSCSRLSPPVPGPRGSRGHTCRTPPRGACSVSNAILTIRKVPGWHVRGVQSETEVGPWSLAARSHKDGGRREAVSVKVNLKQAGGRYPLMKEISIPTLALHRTVVLSVAQLAVSTTLS